MRKVFMLALVCLLVFISATGQVVSGNTYTLRSGQTLSRDLVITGGSSTLEQGSRVTGSLRVTGGSLKANGEIDGDVHMTGGSIAFGSSAVVRGVVSTTGGGIHIAEGASIRPILSYVIRPPAPVQEFLDSDLWHRIWPSAFLVPGLICLAAVWLGGKKMSSLAIPGAVLTTLGLIFLFQKTFDQYQTWAYVWALVLPTSVGVGMYVEGSRSDQLALRERGLRVARVGMILFAILVVFFELMINLSGRVRGDMGWIALPSLLILVGAALLFRKLSDGVAPKPALQMPTDSTTSR